MTPIAIPQRFLLPRWSHKRESRRGIAHEIKNRLNFVTNFSVLNEELAAELDDLVGAHRDEIPAGLISEIEDLLTSLRVNAGHVAKHGAPTASSKA
jgi:hypothetical protein